MRLTLRTILAYLDDVLEPSQAREIGERISEGKEASALVSRIRDVIRRRRIGAPQISGPGSGPDPNLVSEYLENVLQPNQVVELERLCQTSDVHLAEVAACHKILTMVLGQPMDVSDEIRERIYALGSKKSIDAAATPAAPMTEGIGKSNEEDVHETGLPDYLVRSRWSQRYRSVAIVALVTMFWLAIVVTDRTLWQRPEVAPDGLATVTGKDQPVVGEAAPAVVPAGEQPAVAPGQDPAAPAATSPKPENSVVQGSTAMPANPGQAGLNDIEKMPEAAVGATPNMPIATATPMPAASNVPPTPMPPATVPVSPVLPSTAPELPVVYQSGDELMIEANAGQPGWALASTNSNVEVGDEMASPVPYRNTYRIGDSLTMTLLPGTRFTRLVRTEQCDFSLLLNQGQVNFFRTFESKNPATIRLLVLGQEWIITLLEPGTRVGVELSPLMPNGRTAEHAIVSVQGGIVVAEGRISVRSAGQPLLELGPADGYARWPSAGSGLVTKVDLTIPTWASPDGPIVTPAARQVARLYQKEFTFDQSVLASVGPIAKDRRAGISEYAIKTLALTDQWVELTSALRSDHQESRLAAIAGLRHWMLLHPGNEALLKEELTRNFPAEKVDSILRLLWGYTVEDGSNPEISRLLIEQMKDDEITIRELAFQQVSKLSSRTYDYQPMGPAAERRAAVTRWEDYLKRNGGKLIAD